MAGNDERERVRSDRGPHGTDRVFVAQFERAPDRFTVWSNFQGPFILHALMAGALQVPGNRLRLITAPNSGGSFGIKQAMFPYMVLLAAASRVLDGMPPRKSTGNSSRRMSHGWLKNLRT